MGLLSFLQILAANFFNLLSWPSFSLIYPLYASIRAVESEKQFEKCLAYWILFSVTTMLESVFGILLTRFQYWPYVRGLATLLLVTPYFDGASYIYNHFIRPLLNSQVNGLNPLSGTRNCAAIEQREEKELVKHVIYENEYDSAGSYLSWLESPKRYQKEWSCALCLVNVSSRKGLRKHLQGKKHKTMEEKLAKEEALTTNWDEHFPAINMTTMDDLLEKLNTILSPVTRPIRWCKWKKPNVGWMKLNTDGSVDRDHVGFGGIFRDHKGDPICAYVSKAPRYDIFLVELWSIWRGLVLGVGMGIKVIWVESDSLSVVKTINKKQPYGPKAQSCLNHIWKLLAKFEKYEISHSWRETNRAADHLAKMDLQGSDIVLWPKEFPDTLCKIIKDDAQGKRYRRL